MKKASKTSISLVLFLMIFGGSSFGQDVSRLSKSQELSFKDESEKTEITIKTTKDYNHLVIQIVGRFHFGSATFEIIDPKGKIQGNFIVKTDEKITKGVKTTITSQVKGQMHKSFRNPILGDWIVRISPNNGTGYVTVEYEQIYHPKADLMEIEVIEGKEIKVTEGKKVK